MNPVTGLFRVGDLVAFAAGASIVAILGFIRHHQFYVRLVSHLPFLFAMDFWVRVHIFNHPPDAARRIVTAAMSSSAANRGDRAAHRG